MSTPNFPPPPLRTNPDGSTMRTFSGNGPVSGTDGDWPEDFAHENGRYLNTCCVPTCRRQFTGHKRRYVCKVCAEKSEAEQKVRAEFLSAHGAPADWVIITQREAREWAGEIGSLSLAIHVERKVRRELAEAVRNLIQVGDRYSRREADEVFAKSAQLDAEIAAKERARMEDGTL